MNNIRLTFYSDTTDEFSGLVKSCILKYEICFEEINNIDELILQLNYGYTYAIICIKEPYNNELINNKCFNKDHFVKIINPETVDYNHIVSNFIQSLAIDNKILFIHKTSSLEVQLVNIELEKLGLSKKYLGFKYISDIVIESIKRKILDSYNPSLFKRIAIVNQVSEESVERDIRHILSKTWKSSSEIKQLFPTLNKTSPKSHELLNRIVTYIKSLF